MKTNSKVMVYDDNCPLCNAYTSAFVKMGLLEVEGRQAFSEVNATIMCQLDKHKSRNEIPLLDTATNQTWYGLDAMLEVISTKYPLVKTVANTKPIKWFLLRLYKLISYNRKVIVAVPKTSSAFDCTPDFNKKYRLLFLLIITAICYAFITPMYNVFSISNSPLITKTQCYIGFTGFLFINFIIQLVINKSMLWHYLGQVAMLCLLTILLLLPLLIINNIVPLQTGFKSLYVLVLFSFIIKEVWRRKQYLVSVKEFNQRPLYQLK